MIYWVGVTSNWLPLAHSVLAPKPWWGFLMVAAGLITWFTTLIVVVRFSPTASPNLLPPRQRYPGLDPAWFAAFCTLSFPAFPGLKRRVAEPDRKVKNAKLKSGGLARCFLASAVSRREALRQCFTRAHSPRHVRKITDPNEQRLRRPA